jgi:hypothetical protein
MESLSYTYGIDPQGKMYIYDMWNKKMVFYGDPSVGVANVYKYQSEGSKMNFEGDHRPKASAQSGASVAPASNTGGDTGGGSYGSYGASAPKVLDQAQIDAIQSLLSNVDATRDVSKKKAGLKRDASLNEKKSEFDQEQTKYNGKKLTTLQDFADAKTNTDINTRNTLENLISSLSTMGLGGSRALTRQVLDAANMSNRKANATQATNNQSLDSAFNDYKVGNENDVAKINDQYGYDTAEADRQWAQDRQNDLYKMADVYNAGGDTAHRDSLMGEGNNLNGFIANSAFVNPQYTGVSRQMATPDIGSYTQDIAQYNTSGVGADAAGAPAGMPAAVPGAATPGNASIRAMAVNGKDLGVKKKTEGSIAYGV